MTSDPHDEWRRRDLLLDALLGSVAIGVLCEDELRRLVRVNQAFCTLFAIPVPPASLVGADCANAVENLKPRFADPARFARHTDQCIRARQPVSGDEFPLTDGRVIARDYVPLVQGAESRGHLWLYRDVTVRRAAPVPDPDDSRSRMQAILDTSLDAIITVDESGLIHSINPAVEHIFGWDAADLVGELVTVLIPGSAQDEAAGDVLGHLSVAQPGDTTTRQESTGRRKDASTFPIDVGVSEMVVRGRRMFTVTVRDITERKEVDRMKNEFVSVVSHELRTPLTSIRGSLGLLEGGVAGELPAGAHELVHIARTSTDRLIRLINDILDLEKIEAGKMELRLSDLTIASLLETTLEGVRGLGEQSGVRFTTSVRTRVPLVGDRDRLVQVLTNLVSNAVKFSPPDGVIELVVELRTDCVHFAVRDHGPGIAEEQRSKLFKKFQQLDSSDSRERGGTGLGLAISKAIVEQHGGEIGVESTVGAGSTFWFRLPLARMRIEDAPSAMLDDQTRHSVLLVEDDGALFSVLRTMINEGGLRLIGAATVRQGLEWLTRIRPSVIVVDVQLSDGTGLQLLDAMWQMPDRLDVPAVVITGRGSFPPGTMRGRISDWLMKPFDQRAFLRAVRKAIRRPGPPRVLLVEPDAGLRALVGVQLEPLMLELHEAGNGADALKAVRAIEPDLVVIEPDLPGIDGFHLIDSLRQERQRATPVLVFSTREVTAHEQLALTLGTTRFLQKSRATEVELIRAVSDLLDDVRRGSGAFRAVIPPR